MGDRTLTLHHLPLKGIPLADTKEEVLKHLHRVWGFTVRLDTVDSAGVVVESDLCPD